MIKRQNLIACLSFFAANLFSFYTVFQLSLFNTISANLLADFSLNHTQLGLFSSAYLLANTLWLIPAGMLVDKYSARNLALIFTLLAASTCFVLAKSPWLQLDVVMRFVQGLASAVSLVVSTRITVQWFSRHLGSAMGVLATIALSGGIFANSFFANVVAEMGWRHALFLSGILGLLLFSFMFFFLFEKREKITAKFEQNSNLSNLKHVISNRHNLLYGFYNGLMNLPIFLLAALWGTLYLTHLYGLAREHASHICSFLFLGIIVGAPCIGFLSDKIASRKKPMMGSALLALVLALPLLMSVSLNSTLLELIFFGLGFCSGGQILSAVAITEINALAVRSTAMGVAAFIANLIGTIAQTTFGFLLNFKWSHHFTVLASDNNYTQALMLLPIAFIFCWILSAYTNDLRKNCKPT